MSGRPLPRLVLTVAGGMVATLVALALDYFTDDLPLALSVAAVIALVVGFALDRLVFANQGADPRPAADHRD
ncbi:hypothetical protein Aglo03_13130 [Actinokineospora globicatena]|uniref:Uncharacterized protein n=1 Tax=Actinokineospora globicatena TaxID=103729 RepID=A0A9W6V6L2_9PSEU|nr:hypothetical protein Aglo03_13130 [Actinokineospora globicatena]